MLHTIIIHVQFFNIILIKEIFFLLSILGEGGGSLVIEFITHKHQSSFVMSSTIFPSLTTIFSGGDHHSSPHSTISPNQQIHSQNHKQVQYTTRDSGHALSS
ncbi:hypothetical protein Hanom_Chr16g01421361 [Helianthus anomalus]